MMNTLSIRQIDIKKYLGSAIMFSFGMIALYRWSKSGELFFILLSLRDFVASYFLSNRQRAIKTSSNTMVIIAYISSALPLFYLSAPLGLVSHLTSLLLNLTAILGFLIVTWATIDLGDRLGVSPAKRGEKVTSGMYGIAKHPMYLGYLIAQSGLVLLNPLNGFIWALAFILFVIRAKNENVILDS